MVERAGRVAGDIVRLRFRAGELDDALKSLTVVDRAGGRVLCIDYEMPVPGDDRNVIALTAGAVMLDLMEHLVGSKVRLEIRGRAEAIEGRVTGLQYAGKRRRLEGAALMLFDERAGAVQAIAVDAIQQLVALEGRVTDELRRFLDAGRQPGGTRLVALRMTPGEHDLFVSYLVPAAAWRASYRVIAQADAGTLLLEGWGLVDNPSDEDLEQVSVSLVSGQPISFVYELADARVPARARIGDESPVAGDCAAFAASTACGAAGGGREVAASGASRAGTADSPVLDPGQAVAARRAAGDGARTVGRTAQPDESFAYEVLQQVTIRRGASVLVPILRVQLPCRRELLFDERRHARHPVVTLRCRNDSGLVLERGPATVIEDGSYRGETVLPSTRRGAALCLPYAVELSIDVAVSEESAVETQCLSIREGMLHEDTAEIRTRRYAVANRGGEARTVTIQCSAESLPGELVDGGQPGVRADGEHRWDVHCPAGATTTFTIGARQSTRHSDVLVDLPLRRLDELLRRGALEPGLGRTLAAVRAELGRIHENDEQSAALAERRKRVIARQEHLRTNIATLAVVGDEGEVRLRMVRELQATEGVLSGIDQLIGELAAENERRRRAIMSAVPGVAPAR